MKIYQYIIIASGRCDMSESYKVVFKGGCGEITEKKITFYCTCVFGREGG